MSLKSRIARTVCFLLVFFLLFFLVQDILSSNSHNSRRMDGLYAEEENSLDVLYVGASEVETFISPVQIYEEYGITGYDLCFDGTSFGLYEVMIREAMQTQNPQAIVVELNITDVPDNPQIRAVLDNMRWSPYKLQAVEEYGQDPFWSFVLPIGYYHTRWKNISPALGHTYFALEETYNYRAWEAYSLWELFAERVYPLKGMYTSSKVEVYDLGPDWKMTEEVQVPSQDYMRMLDSLLDYLDTLDCQVIFVNTPGPKVDQLEGQKEQNYVAGYLEQRGYPYLEYARDPESWGFDMTRDMGDVVHANIHGCVKFSRVLGAYLAENVVTQPPERSAETLTQWEKAVAVWHNCLEHHGATQ